MGSTKSKLNSNHSKKEIQTRKAIRSAKQVSTTMQEIQILAPRKTVTRSGTLKVKLMAPPDENFKVFYLDFAQVSQTGWYPQTPNKPNQDFGILKAFPPLPEFDKEVKKKGELLPTVSEPASVVLFGIFDGHGKFGTECAVFAGNRVASLAIASLEKHSGSEDEDQIRTAIKEAYLKTDEEMHAGSQGIDDEVSGTTAVCAFLVQSTLYLANVGDSRAVMGVRDPTTNSLFAENLSLDQTPFRVDERQRIKQAGGRVLNIDQIDGKKPITENDDYGKEEEDAGDPPRVWLQGKRTPGVCFTRSLGDREASAVGVCGEPEIIKRDLSKFDEFLIVASDGVFEFLTSQAVCNIVASFSSPLDAARAVVAESYRLWLRYEIRTDDISCFVVKLKDGLPVRAQSAEDVNRLAAQPSMESRPVRREVARRRPSVQITFDYADYLDYSLPSFPKSQEAEENLSASLRANALFRHLTDVQLANAVAAFEPVPVHKGQVLIKQFDKGDRFYIVEDGIFDVTVQAPHLQKNPDPNAYPSMIPIPGSYEKEATLVQTYESFHANQGAHPSFGEIALLYDEPRSATVTARTNGLVYALDKKAFHAVLLRTPTRVLLEALRRVELLKPLSRDELSHLTDMMAEERFKEGETILKLGEVPDACYVIMEGGADLLDKDGSVTKHLNQYDAFGTHALVLSEQARDTTVVAVGGPLRTLSVHRRDLKDLSRRLKARGSSLSAGREEEVEAKA